MRLRTPQGRLAPWIWKAAASLTGMSALLFILNIVTSQPGSSIATSVCAAVTCAGSTLIAYSQSRPKS